MVGAALSLGLFYGCQKEISSISEQVKLDEVQDAQTYYNSLSTGSGLTQRDILAIPNKSISVFDNAVACWNGETMSQFKNQLIKSAHKFDFPIHKPIAQLTKSQYNVLWSGNEHFEGITSFFKMLEHIITLNTPKDSKKMLLESCFIVIKRTIILSIGNIGTQPQYIGGIVYVGVISTTEKVARLLRDDCKDDERQFKSISLYNLASSANNFKLVFP